MTPDTLFRFGAITAILGGGLRVIAAFVPYTSGAAALELFYATIDLLLLAGLIAIYLREASRVGWFGLAAFSCAFGGLASIVGPDATAFGVDFYQFGAAIAALGMAGLGVSFLVARRQKLPALLWLAVPFTAISQPQVWAFQAAGILFGLGFVAAGFGIWLRTLRCMS